MLDIIIRGASVLDGTGLPASETDVGISKDKIVVLGDLAGQNGETAWE
jgi:N-acyl-D-aspartate/D-glutamate deacylase